MSKLNSKFGARVYFYDDGVILVKQTVRKGGKGTYVIDEDINGHKERHVNKGDISGLSEAVLAAGRGELISNRK